MQPNNPHPSMTQQGISRVQYENLLLPAPALNERAIEASHRATLAAIDAEFAELDEAQIPFDRSETHSESNDEIQTHAEQIDKSATRKQRKSLAADGDLVRDLCDSGYFARIDASSSSVVCLSDDSLHRPHVHPSTSSTRPPVTLPVSPRTTKPKQWRDVGESVRGLMFHAAISRMPNVRAFTLRLSGKIEKLARSLREQCLRELHKRMERFLRRHLKPSGAECLYWWFKIEEAPKDGALHIHGEIQVNPDLEPIIRKALKAVGGDWDGVGRGNAQLRLTKDAPTFRWSGYCLKECLKVGPARRRFGQKHGIEDDRRWVAQFHGKSVTASSALRKAAEAEYRSAVEEVKRFRSAASGPTESKAPIAIATGERIGPAALAQIDPVDVALAELKIKPQPEPEHLELVPAASQPEVAISDSTLVCRGRAKEFGAMTFSAAAREARRRRPSESSDDYPRIVVMIDPRTRVIECADGIQWIFQKRAGNQWNGQYFCRTKEALLYYSQSTAPELVALPERFPERENRPSIDDRDPRQSAITVNVPERDAGGAIGGNPQVSCAGLIALVAQGHDFPSEMQYDNTPAWI
jgi:hypothetical protein